MPTSSNLGQALSDSSFNMVPPGSNAATRTISTGIPILDAVFSNSAATIASLTGNNSLQLMATPGPGMNMRDAFMARDVTSPLLQTMRDQAAYEYGGAFGRSVAVLGSTIGVNRMLNMTPDQFSRELVNAGSSPMGRAAMEFMLQQPAMQAMVGGNPMAVAESIFSQRFMLGHTPGGSLFNPMDIVGQAQYAQHASDINLSLLRSAYSGPYGAMGVLNPDVTRGFSFDEFSYMGLRAAQQGLAGMRGLNVNPDAYAWRTGMVTDMMAAVRSNVGPMGVPQMFDQLERIAPHWAQTQGGDLRGVTAALHEIKGLSSILGGNVFSTTANVGETMRAAGFDVGMAPSIGMAARIHSIANNMGGNTEDITARHTAMLLTNLMSKQGSDAIAMEWMRQTMVGDPKNPMNQHASDIYTNWHTAIRYGNKAEQEQWAQRMYDTVMPGMRGVMNDPIAKATVLSHMLTPGSQDIVVRTVTTGAVNELTERTRENIVTQMEDKLSTMETRSGLSFADTAGVEVDAAVRNFDAIINDPEIQKKNPGLVAAAKAAKERLAGIEDPRERRMALESMLTTGPLKTKAGEIKQRMADADVDWRYNRLADMGEDAYVERAQQDILNAYGYRDKSVGDFGSDTAMGKTLSSVAESARRDYRTDMGSMEAMRFAGRLASTARTMEGGVSGVLNGVKMLSEVLAGTTPSDIDVNKVIDDNPLLDSSQKQRYREAVKTKDKDKLQQLRSELSQATFAFGQGQMLTATELGAVFKTGVEAAGIESVAVQAQGAAKELGQYDAALDADTYGKNVSGLGAGMKVLNETGSIQKAVEAVVGVTEVAQSKSSKSGGGQAGQGGAGGSIQIEGVLSIVDNVATIKAFSKN